MAFISFLVPLPLQFATAIPPTFFLSATDKKYRQDSSLSHRGRFVVETGFQAPSLCCAVSITEFTLAFSPPPPQGP